MIAELNYTQLAGDKLNPKYTTTDAMHRLLYTPFREINYYYPIKSIQEDVYRRTSIIGKHRRTEDGKNLLDVIALSEDDEDTFMSLCRNASLEVYEICKPYMSNEYKSLFFNEDYDTIKYSMGINIPKGRLVEDGSSLFITLKDIPNTSNIPTTDTEYFVEMPHDFRHSVHYIIQKPAYVIENSLPNTDRLIHECLVLYIIYQWFLIVFPSESELYVAMYNNALRNLKISLMSNRQMSVISHPF